MIKSIINIFKAAKIASEEKNRQKKQFKQKQGEIYREGLIESKLREQITSIVEGMYEDPSITSVKIEIAEEGLPFASGIISQLECEVASCASPAEFILYPRNSFI